MVKAKVLAKALRAAGYNVNVAKPGGAVAIPANGVALYTARLAPGVIVAASITLDPNVNARVFYWALKRTGVKVNLFVRGLPHVYGQGRSAFYVNGLPAASKATPLSITAVGAANKAWYKEYLTYNKLI